MPDEELFRFHTEQVREIGVHLCGRRLYETMVYWDTAEESPLPVDQVEFAQIWKALPKVVFSTTLERVVGNTRLASGGVGAEVRRLREQPGKDIAVGGAGLARACMELGPMLNSPDWAGPSGTPASFASSVRGYRARIRFPSRWNIAMSPAGLSSLQTNSVPMTPAESSPRPSR